MAEMLEADCVPDNQSWTTYVVALLEKRDWTAAVRVIHDMGTGWQQAKEETPSPDLEARHNLQRLPDIVPINAAITGLLRLGLHNVAQDILQWARDFPVDIDASTYNIFLLHQFRCGNSAGVDAILKDMETNGVAQDVVTKTIILDAELRNPHSQLHHQDASNQEDMVLKELKNMADNGQTPNAQTFAVVLHALLHVAKPNLPAANAVFRLLLQQDQEISPHIYTILFTHYFKADKPDLEALDSLWNKLEKEKSRIDHVLYDRMIEGYATLGEIGRMITFFRKMTDAGQVPGWLAMEKALSAIVKHRRWDLCADFISDVTNEGGHMHLGKRGWRGEKEFWRLVSELEEQDLIPKVRRKQIGTVAFRGHVKYPAVA